MSSCVHRANAPRRHNLRLCAVFLCVPLAAIAIPARGNGQTSPAPVVLDRVVAVVNGRAILESDLNEETLLSVLEPGDANGARETRQEALERLISRIIIRQQIRVEDARSIDPTAEDIEQRLWQIRKQLPVCVRENCASDDGWRAFLSRHGLTQTRVEVYMRNRIQILRFIEMRFRQGIQISPQEVEAYYRDTLVPQYQAGQSIPKLAEVSPRIEEILLQREVNAMFSGWLDSLRKQGEVEVLDSSLEAAGVQGQRGTAAP